MIRLIESNPERKRIWTTSLKCAILWLRHVTDYIWIYTDSRYYVYSIMDINPTHFVKRGQDWINHYAQLCWTICDVFFRGLQQVRLRYNRFRDKDWNGTHLAGRQAFS